MPDRLPLLDHAGQILGIVDRDKALSLAHRGAVLVGTRKKVKAVQLPGNSQWETQTPRSSPRSEVHRLEQWDNPRGVWKHRRR